MKKETGTDPTNGPNLRTRALNAAIATASLVLAAAPVALGFSLLGPFQPWMDETKSYYDGGAIGGPMNMGQEFRWNVPEIYYGFDDSFVEYIGVEGIRAVDTAFSLFNRIPKATDLSADLREAPLDTKRINFRAASPPLLDLKSLTMQLILEQMGLAPPERYIFALRDHIHKNGETSDVVMNLNFDPENQLPSEYVNDIQYFSTPTHYDAPHRADVVERPLDPTAIAFTSVAGHWLRSGEFFTGFTRDELAGLRFLLHPSNFNPELHTPGVRRADGGVASGAVFAAGVDGIEFQRLPFDPLGNRFLAVTSRWEEAILQNNEIKIRSLERRVSHPDIIFSVRPLGARGGPVLCERTGTDLWRNSLGGIAGPGLIHGPIEITFNDLSTTDFVSTAQGKRTKPGVKDFAWGSFDGTANPPVKFPVENPPPPASDFRTLQTLMESAIHHWPLDVSGRDGVGDAPLTVAIQASFVGGVFGEALKLNGIDTWASSAPTASPPPVTDWTISLWTRWRGLTGLFEKRGQQLIYIGNGGADGYGIVIRNPTTAICALPHATT